MQLLYREGTPSRCIKQITGRKLSVPKELRSLRAEHLILQGGALPAEPGAEVFLGYRAALGKGRHHV